MTLLRILELSFVALWVVSFTTQIAKPKKETRKIMRSMELPALPGGISSILPPLPSAPLTVDSAPIEGNAAHAEITVRGAVSRNGIKEKICGELARISTLIP